MAAGGRFLKMDLSTRNTKPYKDCAIVASSKALKGKHLGMKIDSNEVVMRMNGAPTKGYEKDVGSKTTSPSTNTEDTSDGERNRRRLCRENGRREGIAGVTQS